MQPSFQNRGSESCTARRPEKSTKNDAKRCTKPVVGSGKNWDLGKNWDMGKKMRRMAGGPSGALGNQFHSLAGG